MFNFEQLKYLESIASGFVTGTVDIEAGLIDKARTGDKTKRKPRKPPSWDSDIPMQLIECTPSWDSNLSTVTKARLMLEAHWAEVEK